MTEVYLARLRAKGKDESVPAKVLTLFHRAGFCDLISERDFAAIKVHFGEPGNTGFIPAYNIRPIAEAAREAGARPFVTDANTIYLGGRSNAVDHLKAAYDHGFLPSVVGAPAIIADGLRGRDFVRVPVEGKHFREVNVASAIAASEVLIGASHFKGHMLAGFGGTLKNIGMGCAARSGKQLQHSDLKPEVDADTCVACLECMRACPVSAISVVKGKAHIGKAACIGCGECTATCRFGAIAVQWKTDNRAFLEKMVEYAQGVLKGKSGKCGFYNFIVNVTPDCDCLGWSDAYLVQDVGIVASTDPVAIDQASADLVNAAAGLPGSRLTAVNVADKIRDVHDVPWEHQLEYAEQLGLGERKYDLIEI